MRCDHDEPGILQKVRLDDAVVYRAIADDCQHRPDIGLHALRILQLADRFGAAERLQRPNTPADQLIDYTGDEAVPQIVGSLRLDAHRGQ